MPANLADQFNQVLENLLRQTDRLLTQYTNVLAREEFEADRILLAEEIGAATANGSITLTNKITQPALITSVLISFDVNKAVTLTIDRYSQIVQNGQNSTSILAPVKYLIGPGQKLQISWGTAPTNMPYFAVFGNLIGSHFG